MRFWNWAAKRGSQAGTNPETCSVARFGDSFRCMTCGVQWKENDQSPPDCPGGPLKPVIRSDRVLPESAIGKQERANAADILANAADTFRLRNAVYKNNYENVAAVMQGLFPDGVHLTKPEHFKCFHLLELMVVKLTRFCNSGMTHPDSIHDIAVYAAMIEALNHEGGIK